jgi:hypothetical protein
MDMSRLALLIFGVALALLRSCASAVCGFLPAEGAETPVVSLRSVDAPVLHVAATDDGGYAIVAGHNTVQQDDERQIFRWRPAFDLEALGTVRIDQDERNEGWAPTADGWSYSIVGIQENELRVVFVIANDEEAAGARMVRLPCCARDRWLAIPADEPRGIMLVGSEGRMEAIDVRLQGIRRRWILGTEPADLVTSGLWSATLLPDGRIAIVSSPRAGRAAPRMVVYLLADTADPGVTRYAFEAPPLVRMATAIGQREEIGIVAQTPDGKISASVFDPSETRTPRWLDLTNNAARTHAPVVVASAQRFVAAWLRTLEDGSAAIEAREFSAQRAGLGTSRITEQPVNPATLPPLFVRRDADHLVFVWSDGENVLTRRVPAALSAYDLIHGLQRAICPTDY